MARKAAGEPDWSDYDGWSPTRHDSAHDPASTAPSAGEIDDFLDAPRRRAPLSPRRQPRPSGAPFGDELFEEYIEHAYPGEAEAPPVSPVPGPHPLTEQRAPKVTKPRRVKDAKLPARKLVPREIGGLIWPVFAVLATVAALVAHAALATRYPLWAEIAATAAVPVAVAAAMRRSRVLGLAVQSGAVAALVLPGVALVVAPVALAAAALASVVAGRIRRRAKSSP